ncbi:uncharacterized protein METZ01_LOCUS201215 [marine metagenome]|uniref:Uncharacterized protein n=1 Tax=marine metagenome TaxID=408172 RepID=A0A382EEF0_9ZZZZ|tara:strand:- start:1223 stop:1648 length:426 start_codon:yes stop_codon:yes gene_type:complete
MNVNKPLYMKDDNNDWINILLKNDYFKEINSNDNINNLQSINPETRKIVKGVIDDIINKVVDNVVKEEREKIIKDMITDIINNVSQEKIQNLYTDIETDLNNENEDENEDDFYKNIFTDTLKLLSVACGVKLVFDFLEFTS